MGALHKSESSDCFIALDATRRCKSSTLRDDERQRHGFVTKTVPPAQRIPALLRHPAALECRRMVEARFQTFDDSSERAQSAARVAALRAELKRRGLDGFVVPRADRQQNEYLPASEERLAWLTGFTGSAGFAIALAERGALFTDGRYTVEVRAQT